MDGAVSAPALSFNSETTTGFYRPTANTLSVAVGGTETVRVNNYGCIGLSGANYGTTGQYLTSNGPTAAPTWNTQADSPPPGAIIHFARNTAPTGYLKANGAAVSRTTYAALFAAIGTTWGAGDGVSTFNIPDLRGVFVRGWDDARGIDSGRAFASYQDQDNAPHSHGISDPGHNHTINNPSHNHSLSDPGHAHSISDPGHSHSVAGTAFMLDSGGGTYYCGGSSAWISSSSHVGTGIGIYGAVTGVYSNAATQGSYASATTTNVTTVSSGVENRVRNYALLACIKY